MKEFKDVYSETRDKEKLKMGAGSRSGEIVLFNHKGVETMKLDGKWGALYLGGKHGKTRTAEDGDLIVKDFHDNKVVIIDGRQAKLTLGGRGVDGKMSIRNKNNIETIRVTGQTGDIEFLNADFAEEFEMDPSVISEIKPGTVVRLAENGLLVPCDQNMDSRAVGVVAGGGDYKPGIVMDKNGGENRLPIALLGKVACKVDTANGPIQVGDLLTTSNLSGHATKVINKVDAIGSIIGKALSPLASGEGEINILVNLI